ncbi:MAG: hypothetical protein IJP98_04840 [Clostridia bacterium]|nr:hypothetical protein [Clostridia bacterium]
MFKHGDVSTETDRKPFLFTLIAASGSTIAAVLLFALGKGEMLSILSGVMVLIVAAVSWFILFVMLTDYAYIDQGVLRTRYLFKKTQIPLGEIQKVTCKENVYYIYGRREKPLGTINGLLSGIDSILEALENNGVHFE